MEFLYYLSNRLYRWHVPLLPRLIMLLIRLVYQSFVPYTASIGPGVKFGHRQGIVLAEDVKLGARCKIWHQVTIARGRGGATVGDDFLIGAGAKILGGIHIGNRVKIGANAVVVEDVPDDATVVGIPVRVVKLAGTKVENVPDSPG
jgi:serine O-acetyltransferase